METDRLAGRAGLELVNVGADPPYGSRGISSLMEADVISTRMMGRACVGGRTLKKAKKR
jgi:hypothetical protein